MFKTVPVKTALVLGSSGFIGQNMVRRLKSEGYQVKGCDWKFNQFHQHAEDEFDLVDLSDQTIWTEDLFRCGDDMATEVYQFAADMGGANYIFTGEHDFEIMTNSVQINLNLATALASKAMRQHDIRVFYSSSACIYPKHNQINPTAPDCEESTAYPADPDSEYGWEKLFSERLYLTLNKKLAKNVVRIGRYHNIYGPLGTYDGGREKAPAAICRKIILAPDNGVIDIYGDGKQTRSFLYIDDCINATRLMMQSDFVGPVNIGSEEMVTINDLVDEIATIANKTVRVNHVDGPTGVRGRNSFNRLIEEKLKWKPEINLNTGLTLTYSWIKEQIHHETTAGLR